MNKAKNKITNTPEFQKTDDLDKVSIRSVSQNSLQFNLTGNINEDLNVIIYNLHGEAVVSKRMMPNTDNAVINWPSLNAGIYFLKVYSKQEIYLKEKIAKP